MPTYEYLCPTHGLFEKDQRITEDALATCPLVGKGSVCNQPIKRQIGKTSFIWKCSVPTPKS